MEFSRANRRPEALLKYPLSLAFEGGSIERRELHQAEFPTQKRYRIFESEAWQIHSLWCLERGA
jgi:hypothetical protein